MKAKIELGDNEETLLIPLAGRADDARSPRSVLGDTRAAEMVDAIDYDFAQFSGQSQRGSVIRASIFDAYIRDFLAEHPDGTVVDLGCGLSTRFDRLDNGRVTWFDLDMPDTMALRRRFISDADRYTMLDGSIFDEDWYDVVAPDDRPILLVSEAVLLYFDDEQVRELLRRLHGRFGGARLVVDTSGGLMINSQDRNRMLRNLPARMKWICDDPASLEREGLTLLASKTYGDLSDEARSALRRWESIMLRILSRTPVMGGYRINLFEL